MTLSIFAAAREAPEGTALVAGGRALSFAALADAVRGALAELHAAGLVTGHAPELPVAFDATPDVQALLRLHALVALGIPALPLHPVLTPAERSALLARTPIRGDLGASSPEPDPPAAAPDATPEDDERPLAVVLTSGSTGGPRGVVLSRRAFSASARASQANLGWRDDDRWLLSLPVAHVGGLSVVTRCLMARRAVVLGPAPGLSARAVEPLIETVERDRVTLLSLVPAQLQALLDRTPAWRLPAHVRAALLGGGPTSPALRRRARERGWPILATYGLTEACSQVATQSPDDPDPDDESCGRPLPGVEVRVHGGVLEVRGPTLLSGYHPPAGPPTDAGGWHATRDRARLDEAGRLHVLGRHDGAILSGGETVQPEEVERVLETLPGVARAFVFGVADALRGEVVAAALEARADATLDPGELALGWSERLAAFRRPRRLALLDALPLTPTGKLDRRRARERAVPALRPVPR